MNEKIKELADKAGLYTDVSGRWVNASSMDKFIELLVSECVELFPLTIRPLSGNSIQSSIKEHFGIEK